MCHMEVSQSDRQTESIWKAEKCLNLYLGGNRKPFYLNLSLINRYWLHSLMAIEDDNLHLYRFPMSFAFTSFYSLPPSRIFPEKTKVWFYRMAQSKHVCNCTINTETGFVFPSCYSQVMVEEWENLLKKIPVVRAKNAETESERMGIHSMESAAVFCRNLFPCQHAFPLTTGTSKSQNWQWVDILCTRSVRNKTYLL